jgi:hypothetical protein
MARASKGIPPTVNNFIAMMQSMLTQYDQKVSARERFPNIYRLGHLLEAGHKVEADLGDAGVRDDDVMNGEIAAAMYEALARRFEPGFPPIKKVVKQISEFLATGKNPSLIA